MRVNDEGVDLIKRFEGLSLEAYLDPVGIWTIGYGHIQDVSPGMTITQEDADAFLRADIAAAELAIERLVNVSLNENEHGALVSLVFNIGEHAFAESALLNNLNREKRIRAADAFEWWNKGRIDNRLYIIPGLVRRRAVEKALFLRPAEEKTPSHAPFIEAMAAKRKVGLESRITPEESPRTRRHSLSASREIRAAALIAGFGAAMISTGMALRTEQKTPVAGAIMSFLTEYSSPALALTGTFIVLAAAYIAYARWDSWRDGRR